MKKTEILLLLIAIATPQLAMADDLTPGLWEVTMESRVPAETGWTPTPFNLKHCLSVSDAKDPSKLVGSISTQGASGCNFTEKSYSAGVFRFAMDCAGSFGLKTKGSMTFGATSFSGNITATGDLGGQITEFQNRVSGKRVGGC
ncbi:MAG: DUF3617 family protein [Proteobacteria bacterium]|nr:DUF3617 family protein [Pseudomonadota bacterium]